MKRPKPPSEPPARKPTLRQMKFAVWLLSERATSFKDAAIRAGYSEHSARWIASKNLRNTAVQAETMRIARSYGEGAITIAEAFLR